LSPLRDKIFFQTMYVLADAGLEGP